MKNGVFHTNGFKPLEEVARIIGKSEPNCSECFFRRDCGPGCLYKEMRWYLEEYQAVLERPLSERLVDVLREVRKE